MGFCGEVWCCKDRQGKGTTPGLCGALVLFGAFVMLGVGLGFYIPEAIQAEAYVEGSCLVENATYKYEGPVTCLDVASANGGARRRRVLNNYNNIVHNRRYKCYWVTPTWFVTLSSASASAGGGGGGVVVSTAAALPLNVTMKDDRFQVTIYEGEVLELEHLGNMGKWKDANQKLAAHPQGSAAACYYDPAEPRASPGPRWDQPDPFAAGGTYLIAFGALVPAALFCFCWIPVVSRLSDKYYTFLK